MTTGDIDPLVADLRAAHIAEIERQIAAEQARANEAGARGDQWYQQWHQAEADRLRALPYPWQQPTIA